METTTPDHKPNIFSFIKRFFGHEMTQMIIVAVAFVFGFVRPFVVEAYKIPSGSMEDTLLVRDRILVWKCMYGIKVPGIKKRLFAFHQPRRGDVFVFLPPHERDKNFIKRTFGKKEIMISKNINNKSTYFSKRYAAKESFVKAVGTGFRNGLVLKEIQIINDKLGKPYYLINSKIKNLIKKKMKVKNFELFLSISDEKEYSIAFTIIQTI